MSADEQKPDDGPTTDLLADAAQTRGDLAMVSQAASKGWEIPPKLCTLLSQRLLLLALNLTNKGEAAGVSVRDQRGAARELMRLLTLRASLDKDKPPVPSAPPSMPAPESPVGERLATLPIIVGTLREVADFFGLSAETIKDWRAKGMPGTPGDPGQSGRYELAEILRWRDATIGPSGRSEPGEATRQEAERRKALAGAEKLELEVRQRKGELIEVAVVLREFTHHNTHARALFEQGPHRLLGLLPAGATGDDKRRFLREAEKWIAGVMQAIHEEALGRVAQTGDPEQES